LARLAQVAPLDLALGLHLHAGYRQRHGREEQENGHGGDEFDQGESRPHRRETLTLAPALVATVGAFPTVGFVPTVGFCRLQEPTVTEPLTVVRDCGTDCSLPCGR